MLCATPSIEVHNHQARDPWVGPVCRVCLGCGEDQGHHGVKPVVAQDPEVLELVALPDEADRLLDEPAVEVGLDEASDERREQLGLSVVSSTSVHFPDGANSRYLTGFRRLRPQDWGNS